MIFREATRDDVAAVVAMLADDHLGAQRETGTPQEYLEAFDRMQGRTLLVVGEDAGRIVATYQLTLIPGLSHRAALRAQIESVRVAADLRGRGLGALLMLDAEDRARRAGAVMMQLTTHVSRDRAHAFYARNGYEQSHLGFKKMLRAQPEPAPEVSRG